MIPQNVARHATVGRETVSTERTTEKGEESFPNYGNIKKGIDRVVVGIHNIHIDIARCVVL